MALVVMSSLSAFVFTRSVRRDNERRLLGSQADQIGELVNNLGIQQQGPVAAAAVIANRTSGDPQAFQAVVSAQTPPGEAVEGWALLTRDATGVKVASTAGADAGALAIYAFPSPEVSQRLAAAFDGKFEVVGLLGTGLSRRLVMAQGMAGPGHPYVAYYEIPLLEAAGASGSGQVFGAVNLALYVGTAMTPANLVLATGAISGDVVTRVVNIGDYPITFSVSAKRPLAGGLATNLPWMIVVFLLVAGAVVSSVVEMNQRKRDDALRLVD